MADKRYVDEISGVETTGHEWDGIRELDNPMPNWWRWIFYATIVWSVGYWFVYPAWPLIDDYTRGFIGYSSRAEVSQEIVDARAAQAVYSDRIRSSDLETIRTDPELLNFALSGGRALYNVNCSQCHGGGAQGAAGYPNLNDDEWLWGGSIDEIYHTVSNGVRNNQSDEARDSAMPAFGRDGILERPQIAQIVDYVRHISGNGEMTASATQGQALFTDNCAACHGEQGQGLTEFGAPALNNNIWLYGGDTETLTATITNSRAGVMPAWGKILDDVAIKKLAIYVHSLGGGK
ncbi:cytochrome-c oxidase, cbb3-type subunit III [Alphaproteobacteria bacterium HT1-32]|nr:cytochrome-c oxidase, cbb3-type subunit III [Alphaproteobacteria bacterium HT1-32]